MGHSRMEKADSRERILDAAARRIRQDGLESVSIAELMKAANLTHGGFYGHFRSRAALIAAALERALERGEAASLLARIAAARRARNEPASEIALSAGMRSITLAALYRLVDAEG